MNPEAVDSNRSQRIADPVADAARRHPERPALVHPDGEITYGALDRIVRRTAAALEARPDRIAGCMKPTWRYCALLLAVWRAGRAACPLSTRAPNAGLARQLEAVDAGLLVTTRTREGPLEKYDLLEVHDVLEDDGLLENYYILETTARTDEADRHANIDQLETWDLDAPATLLFTSGSTSEPRAALHSLGNHVWNARGTQHAIPLGEGDRWCLSLPLYHVGGLAILFRCMLAGAAVVLPSESAPLHATLEKHRVTHLSVVPTQLERLLANIGGAAASLKAVLLGGGPLPPDLVATALQRGIPLHTTYGLTEMASQVTGTTAGDRAEGAGRLKTAGRALPHRELRIDGSGSDGQEETKGDGQGELPDDSRQAKCPDGDRQGEIQVRGATLFQGYVVDGALERPLTSDGWFATGDVGRMDDVGCLHVIGRMDDLFVSGGENIHPEEIEQALLALTGVARAAVVSVPDPTYGARPVAFVQVRSESRPGIRHEIGPGDLADILRAELSKSLPKYKIPDAFFPWSRIPEEAFTGGLKKVKRSTLARHAQEVMGAAASNSQRDDRESRP